MSHLQLQTVMKNALSRKLDYTTICVMNYQNAVNNTMFVGLERCGLSK